MSHAQTLYDWEQQWATHFPEFSAARRSWLAWISSGIVLAGCARLSTVLLRLAVTFDLSFNSLRQRLRRWYRPEKSTAAGWDYTLFFAPLLRWAVAGISERRLALAIDPTNLTDRFPILTVSVVCQGCAIPVAWKVVRADEKGSWNTHWKQLLTTLHAALGAHWQVVVLSDRGLESKTLFESITTLGWHPLMRVKQAGCFQPNGWQRAWPMGHFADHCGARWSGTGIAWPGSARLRCTLLACQDADHDTPWLILTDLAPDSASVGWYAWRTWMECGFRDLKSDGWDLAPTRMTDPDRVGRWWAACALAQMWVLQAGHTAQRLQIPAWRTHASKKQGRCMSLFALGFAWLASQLGRQLLQALDALQLPQWVRENLPNTPIDEQDWIRRLQTVPL